MKNPVFAAKVEKIGINPFVRVDPDIVRALQQAAKKSAGPLPVRIQIGGGTFAATIVCYKGLWRLYLNLEIRKAAGVEVGDTVSIRMAFDGRARRVPVPKKLAWALARHPRFGRAFETLIPSRRKEILQYLNSLKTDESLERNIRKVMRILGFADGSRARRRRLLRSVDADKIKR